MDLTDILILFSGIMIVLFVTILWLKNGQDNLRKEIKDLYGRICGLEHKQNDLSVRQNEARMKIVHDELRKK